MNMKVHILKRSHSNVNFVRKDILGMEIVLNMSIHVSEENHSNVLVAPILNYVSIYKAIMGKVLQMSIM